MTYNVFVETLNLAKSQSRWCRAVRLLPTLPRPLVTPLVLGLLADDEQTTVASILCARLTMIDCAITKGHFVCLFACCTRDPRLHVSRCRNSFAVRNRTLERCFLVS